MKTMNEPLPGQLPLIVMLAITPLANSTVITELISTGAPWLSTSAKTCSTSLSTVHSSVLSGCAPESYACPPPDSFGSWRHLPVVPRIQFCEMKPLTSSSFPIAPERICSRSQTVRG